MDDNKLAEVERAIRLIFKDRSVPPAIAVEIIPIVSRLLGAARKETNAEWIERCKGYRAKDAANREWDCKSAYDKGYADALRAAAELVHQSGPYGSRTAYLAKQILALTPERARLLRELEVARARVDASVHRGNLEVYEREVADLEAKLASLDRSTQKVLDTPT